MMFFRITVLFCISFILWGANPLFAQGGDTLRVGEPRIWQCPIFVSAVSSPATDSIFGLTIKQIKQNGIDKLPLGERMAAIGGLFLGKPYIDKSLEVGSDRSEVVCNLEGFDCVTLFESVWALSRLGQYSVANINTLSAKLEKTRYRDQVANGFQTRLHYTSDYFYENAKRKLLKEMTVSVGKQYVELESKPINFMTTHPNLYKQLKDDTKMVSAMDSIEKIINSRGGFHYIKKENVAKIESGIQTGDILGITTSIAGIDCSHTGIAVRGDDGRIHFMHASSAMHKVIITDIPLADYLVNNSKQTGIMIYRPQEVGK